LACCPPGAPRASTSAAAQKATLRRRSAEPVGSPCAIILVVGQVAVALVFLAVAALFIRGFGRGQQRDLGFTQKNLLLATVA